MEKLPKKLVVVEILDGLVNEIYTPDGTDVVVIMNDEGKKNYYHELVQGEPSEMDPALRAGVARALKRG